MIVSLKCFDHCSLESLLQLHHWLKAKQTQNVIQMWFRINIGKKVYPRFRTYECRNQFASNLLRQFVATLCTKGRLCDDI